MTENSSPSGDKTDEADATQRIHRRAVLNGGAGLVVFAGVTAGGFLSAKAADKAAKADVSYQDSPNSGVKCAECRFYDSEGSCEVVEGDISPDGWCVVWTAV